MVINLYPWFLQRTSILTNIAQLHVVVGGWERAWSWFWVGSDSNINKNWLGNMTLHSPCLREKMFLSLLLPFRLSNTLFTTLSPYFLYNLSPHPGCNYVFALDEGLITMPSLVSSSVFDHVLVPPASSVTRAVLGSALRSGLRTMDTDQRLLFRFL